MEKNTSKSIKHKYLENASEIARRDFLKAVGIGSASVVFSHGFFCCGNSQKKPNVVLVITDDQGYGDIACHGNPVIKTPNMDNFYNESVRLTDFHVAPTCAPTRAGLMTGRYCNRTGVWHTVMGRSFLRRDEVTMADVFSANGYKTGIFGKWHLGDNYPYRPQERGFHEVLIHGGGGVTQTPDYWGNDYFDDTYMHNGVYKKFDGYCTDVWFNGAMNFIKENKEEPFFVYLPTNAPHSPFNVADEYIEMYKEKGLDDMQVRFYGMITNIDENLGRLMQHLKNLGLDDNTIIIFMGDNGSADTSERRFNAGMRRLKGSEYDGGHRSFCFVKWRKGELTGGRDVTSLTSHIDLLPTLIDICGLRKPEDIEFDGSSIKPLLEKNGKEMSDRMLIVDSQRIENPEKWRKSAVMTEQWRLVNGKELYNIKKDPGQEKDIADLHSDVVQELRSSYDDWWESTSERFDEYCYIVAGSDKENPLRLTCHDWHAPIREIPWNQRAIKRGINGNGFWAVEIERDGNYRITLRRWPKEAEETGIEAVKAKLKIGDIEKEKQVNPEESEVSFILLLKAGKTKIQTWLTNAEGISRGAYYVYMERL